VDGVQGPLQDRPPVGAAKRPRGRSRATLPRPRYVVVLEQIGDTAGVSIAGLRRWLKRAKRGYQLRAVSVREERPLEARRHDAFRCSHLQRVRRAGHRDRLARLSNHDPRAEPMNLAHLVEIHAAPVIFGILLDAACAVAGLLVERRRHRDSSEPTERPRNLQTRTVTRSKMTTP
jgi:hypothetical protein